MSNARVVYARCDKVFNVGECYDVPWGVAKAYARRHKNDPKYNGGILLVLSMPKVPDKTPSL